MSKNPFAVRADVKNELQNRIYYNIQEIQRLASTDTIPYKDSVTQIISILAEQATLLHAIDLADSYIQVPVPEQPNTPTNPDFEKLGLTKID